MKSKVILSVIIFILVLSFNYVLADVPKMINYQGKLTDSTGALIGDKENPAYLSMQFTIYTDSIDGISLWTETQDSVRVEYGIFSVLLGGVHPIPDSVFSGEIRYLGVKAGDDAEMTPRKAIVSVGYAYRSAIADSVVANGVPPSGFRRIVQNTTWTGTSNTSWTELATLNVAANEVTSYICIISKVAGYIVSCTGGTSAGQLRITIDDVEQIISIPSLLGQSGSGSEVFITYFYEPTATQKYNGFTVRIEGKTSETGSPSCNGQAQHMQTDIWGI